MDEARPLLEVSDLVVTFPSGTRSFAPSMGLVCRSTQARSWGSSANRDRARPRSARPSCGSTSRPLAASLSADMTSPRGESGRCGHSGATCRWSSRTRFPQFNPRVRIEEALAILATSPSRCPAEGHPARVGELLRRVGLPASFRSRFPHELSGGQVAARCDRPRALPFTEARRRRRAGKQARRLRPAPEFLNLFAICSRRPAWPCCSLLTICAWPGISAIGSR